MNGPLPSVFGEWVQLLHLSYKVCGGRKCVPTRDVLMEKKASKGVDRSHVPNSLHSRKKEKHPYFGLSSVPQTRWKGLLGVDFVIVERV